MGKRGAIGLSTSAVVTIIVALVVLVLLVVFVQQSFGNAAARFNGVTQNAQSGAGASDTQPLSVAAPASASRGETMRVDASVYSAVDVSDVALVFSCTGGVLGPPQGSTRDLTGGTPASYIVLLPVLENATTGLHACTVDARGSGGAGSVLASNDFTITVT